MSDGRDLDIVEPAIEELVRLGADVRATGYSFTTITPRSHAIVNARPFDPESALLRDAFGWSRPFAPRVIPASILERLRESGLVEPAGSAVRSRIRMSTLRGDLYIHSAYPTLATDAVFFGPDTYKFVDAIVEALDRRQGDIRRAADICTGAGPGAITIAKTAPRAEVFMVDVNPNALRFAAANAELARTPNARPCLSDKLAAVPGTFDLVVAHPPYLIDRAIRAYRHGGGSLGADLAVAITREALGRLAPGGTLLLFTGVAIVDGEDAFRREATRLAQDAGFAWTYREVDPDVFGEELETAAYALVDRIALVVFEATRGTTPA